MWVNEKTGYFQDWITQLWVKLTGKRLSTEDMQWLNGPAGNTRIIKDDFIKKLAGNNGIIKNPPGAGLIDSTEDLQLSPAERTRVNKNVIRFYEHTLDYNFEIWSKWCGFFYPFGWMLNIIFSRRLQQLNLPLDPMESSKGIQSNIIKIKDSLNNTLYTIWYRILKGNNSVIYSGIYTTARVPNYNGNCLKVIFPLPNGNASVIMKIQVTEDGSLLLVSDGKKFGDPGFYFTLTDGKNNFWGRFVSSMHETIKVYEDEENILRADHILYYFGFIFLKLHYKMELK